MFYAPFSFDIYLNYIYFFFLNRHCQSSVRTFLLLHQSLWTLCWRHWLSAEDGGYWWHRDLREIQRSHGWPKQIGAVVCVEVKILYSARGGQSAWFSVWLLLSHFRVRQTTVSPSGKQPECSRCVWVTELSLPVCNVTQKTYYFEVGIYGHSVAKSFGKFAATVATSQPLLIKSFVYLAPSSESATKSQAWSGETNSQGRIIGKDF